MDKVEIWEVLVILSGNEISLKEAHAQICSSPGAVCRCYMCERTIEQPEEQFNMHGEVVCQDCWDYNMYQALQDGGAWQFYNYTKSN